MKKKYTFLLLLFCSLITMAQTNPLRCGNELFEYNEETKERMAELEVLTQQSIAEREDIAFTREEFTIPVVVHIVYTSEEDSLSMQRVESQIAVLNEDFNGRNKNMDLIPTEFRDKKAAIGFNFCLAKFDEGEGPPNGVTWHRTDFAAIANTFDTKASDNKPRLFYSKHGGADALDTEHYLNIWVGDTGGKFLGRTSLPGSASSDEDGVVVDYRYFGSGCNPDAAPFHLGRTTTHEVGHYFNLKHVFANTDSNCSGEGDFVEDTPQQGKSYTGCPNYPQLSCDTRDMFMNFMDYVDDDCMKLFTVKQKARMVTALLEFRPGLLIYNNCLPEDPVVPKDDLIVYPNPTQHCIYIDWEKEYEGLLEIRLYSASGRLIYSREDNSTFIRSISVDRLPNGVYFLTATYNGKKVTKKVMVGL